MILAELPVRERLIAGLESSSLAAAPEAIAALQAGWSIEAGEESPLAVPCAALVPLYLANLARLRASPSPDAVPIVESTDEFVRQLAAFRSEQGRWYRIKSGFEVGFAVFNLLPGEQPIGCLRTVEGTMMSEERWKEIWGF